MWRKLLWWRQRKSNPLPVHCTISFINPSKERWAGFDGGDNNDARFTVRGNVKIDDEILIRMQSGRIGRYRLFSVLRDWMGVGDWKVKAVAVGYQTTPRVIEGVEQNPAPKIKGLLGDGTRWVRSSSGELAHLPSGFTKPSSEFWEILCRDEACHRRAGSMRSASNL